MVSSPEKNGSAPYSANALHALSVAWQLGFLVTVPLTAFLLLGIAGDRYFHTKPLLVLLGLLIGIVLSVYEVYRVLIPLMARTNHHDQH
jgi:F0F1-type ATP synthase assembly protein I